MITKITLQNKANSSVIFAKTANQIPYNMAKLSFKIKKVLTSVK